MIILGVILLVIGLVTGIGILFGLGLILMIIGVILFLFGSMGHSFRGRRHWF
jgi:membrane-bound ClpP family serine protease